VTEFREAPRGRLGRWLFGERPRGLLDQQSEWITYDKAFILLIGEHGVPPLEAERVLAEAAR
jgi:hypothetical protein